MKKQLIINSSNLALRFYIRNGWTKDLLKSFVKRGQVKECANFFQDDENMRYYIIELGGEMDLDKLFEHDVVVKRAFDDYPHESDREFILRML